MSYLEDYREGKLAQGLGIGNGLDENLRFKKAQFVMINGLDNVGKTYWFMWYALQLSMKHGLKWAIASLENSNDMLTRMLIEFYNKESLKGMEEDKMYRGLEFVQAHFTFAFNEQLWTVQQLLEWSLDEETDALLIDPHNACIKEGNAHESDYRTCSDIRVFCEKTKKTVYINSHVYTEGARKIHKDGDYKDHQMPPSKADTEGGQKFANRADDFITLHRYTQHERDWNKTFIWVRKVRDTDTGGKPTMLDYPITFTHYNHVFTLGGLDASYNPNEHIEPNG